MRKQQLKKRELRKQGLMYVAAFAVALLATPAAAQVVDYGKYPNFKGQWVRGPGSPNNWIPLAGQPPLTPEYKKIWDAITANLNAGGPGNWPSTFCIPAGMPAMMSLYDPAEIIVTPELTYVLVSHNDDSYRRIYTDGRDWPKDPEPTFAGYSIGKWIDEDGDGKYDVLEVETHHQGAHLSRQGQPQQDVRRDHRHRQRADEALRQGADGIPQSRSAADLEVGRVLGIQHACPDRDGKLLSERRWQADAGEEEPGAAGSELLPANAVARHAGGGWR